MFIPEGKRGEAMGIFGITITIGFSLGQAMGSTVKAAFDMDGLFITSGILAALSILLILGIKENKEIVKANAKEKGYTTLYDKIVPKKNEIIGREVLQPSVIMFFICQCCRKFTFLLVPDFSQTFGNRE